MWRSEGVRVTTLIFICKWFAFNEIIEDRSRRRAECAGVVTKSKFKRMTHISVYSSETRAFHFSRRSTLNVLYSLLCRSLFSCKNIIERLASTKIFRKSFVFKFMVELSIAVKKWTVYDTYKCRIKIKLLKDLLRIFLCENPPSGLTQSAQVCLKEVCLDILNPETLPIHKHSTVLHKTFKSRKKAEIFCTSRDSCSCLSYHLEVSWIKHCFSILESFGRKKHFSDRRQNFCSTIPTNWELVHTLSVCLEVIKIQCGHKLIKFNVLA